MAYTVGIARPKVIGSGADGLGQAHQDLSAMLDQPTTHVLGETRRIGLRWTLDSVLDVRHTEVGQALRKG